MTKAELVEFVQKKQDGTKKAAEESVGFVLEGIKKSLKSGGITIVGFGTFKVNQRKARTGRNPKTGQVIKIPAKRVVAFKPGKELKESV